jgi:hypothetical protein
VIRSRRLSDDVRLIWDEVKDMSDGVDGKWKSMIMPRGSSLAVAQLETDHVASTQAIANQVAHPSQWKKFLPDDVHTRFKAYLSTTLPSIHTIPGFKRHCIPLMCAWGVARAFPCLKFIAILNLAHVLFSRLLGET